jgi:acylphosphatase
VQGVKYRYFTWKKAREYVLTGYVKNLPGGSVLCEVEGEEGLVNDFIDDLKVGPPSAQVTGVDVGKSSNLKEYKNFEVRF